MGAHLRRELDRLAANLVVIGIQQQDGDVSQRRSVGGNRRDLLWLCRQVGMLDNRTPELSALTGPVAK
jgi:hypothetical protein